MEQALLIGAIFVASGIFVLFAWAIRFHFSSERMPTKMLLLSVLGLAAFVFYVWSLASSPPDIIFSVAGLLTQLLSLAIFLAAVRQTNVKKLPIAFADKSPEFILQNGIYAHVRHPFYLAYIFFWVGCGLQLRISYFWVCFVILVTVYFDAAQREERSFANSLFAEDYARYRANTGMFLPRLRPKSRG